MPYNFICIYCALNADTMFGHCERNRDKQKQSFSTEKTKNNIFKKSTRDIFEKQKNDLP